MCSLWNMHRVGLIVVAIVHVVQAVVYLKLTCTDATGKEFVRPLLPIATPLKKILQLNAGNLSSFKIPVDMEIPTGDKIVLAALSGEYRLKRSSAEQKNIDFLYEIPNPKINSHFYYCVQEDRSTVEGKVTPDENGGTIALHITTTHDHRILLDMEDNDLNPEFNYLILVPNPPVLKFQENFVLSQYIAPRDGEADRELRTLTAFEPTKKGAKYITFGVPEKVERKGNLVLSRRTPPELFRILCKKRPEQRTPSDDEMVYQEMRHLKSFFHLPNLIIKELAKVARFQNYKNDSLLFEQGSEATNWYTILKGCVGLTVSRQLISGPENEEESKVGTSDKAGDRRSVGQYLKSKLDIPPLRISQIGAPSQLSPTREPDQDNKPSSSRANSSVTDTVAPKKSLEVSQDGGIAGSRKSFGRLNLDFLSPRKSINTSQDRSQLNTEPDPVSKTQSASANSVDLPSSKEPSNKSLGKLSGEKSEASETTKEQQNKGSFFKPKGDPPAMGRTSLLTSRNDNQLASSSSSMRTSNNGQFKSKAVLFATIKSNFAGQGLSPRSGPRNEELSAGDDFGEADILGDDVTRPASAHTRGEITELLIIGKDDYREILTQYFQMPELPKKDVVSSKEDEEAALASSSGRVHEDSSALLSSKTASTQNDSGGASSSSSSNTQTEGVPNHTKEDSGNGIVMGDEFAKTSNDPQSSSNNHNSNKILNNGISQDGEGTAVNPNSEKPGQTTENSDIVVDHRIKGNGSGTNPNSKSKKKLEKSSKQKSSMFACIPVGRSRKEDKAEKSKPIVVENTDTSVKKRKNLKSMFGGDVNSSKHKEKTVDPNISNNNNDRKVNNSTSPNMAEASNSTVSKNTLSAAESQTNTTQPRKSHITDTPSTDEQETRTDALERTSEQMNSGKGKLEAGVNKDVSSEDKKPCVLKEESGANKQEGGTLIQEAGTDNQETNSERQKSSKDEHAREEKQVASLNKGESSTTPSVKILENSSQNALNKASRKVENGKQSVADLIRLATKVDLPSYTAILKNSLQISGGTDKIFYKRNYMDSAAAYPLFEYSPYFVTETQMLQYILNTRYLGEMEDSRTSPDVIVENRQSLAGGGDLLPDTFFTTHVDSMTISELMIELQRHYRFETAFDDDDLRKASTRRVTRFLHGYVTRLGGTVFEEPALVAVVNELLALVKQQQEADLHSEFRSELSRRIGEVEAEKKYYEKMRQSTKGQRWLLPIGGQPVLQHFVNSAWEPVGELQQRPMAPSDKIAITVFSADNQRKELELEVSNSALDVKVKAAQAFDVTLSKTWVLAEVKTYAKDTALFGLMNYEIIDDKLVSIVNLVTSINGRVYLVNNVANSQQPSLAQIRNLVYNYRVPDVMSFVTPPDITDEVFAQSMFQMDQQLFQNAHTHEFIGFEKPRKFKPNQVVLVRRFNHIVHWVITWVILTENLNERAAVIARFLKLMKRLYKCKHFYAYIAVGAGLDHSSVRRLKKTWALVPSKRKGTKKEWGDFTSQFFAYKNYRQTVSETQPLFLPYLAVIQSDITFATDGNRNIEVEENGKVAYEIENYDKAQLVADLVRMLEKSAKNDCIKTGMDRDDNKIDPEIVNQVRTYFRNIRVIDSELTFKTYSEQYEEKKIVPSASAEK